MPDPRPGPPEDEERDPKYAVVRQCLHERGWLWMGCIVFSQYRDSIQWLEDAWVAMALGEKERAKKIIDELPKSHPFELRYTHVAKINWESCRQVLDAAEKQRVLTAGW